ncbi:hypothetical protein DLE60_08810 [Micromonospora globispora]|uniref:YokE-like PH domain-containing protein n=1 Tax=Micromonospora globispora TaxID=1450148 RepID=A0A317JZC8_9ACTN|nr:hypothetical protein [Micromonospora globispora]PWU46051.1 hypothetical protein DLJ46_19225 [Micromonospora globispora]PWU60837.1 hypothetical protein DLE60_08810 [Micromonospora globispora]RQW95705.1 hypothetical protein DKL51_14500 [Micromonospora globispora]
MQQKLQTRAFEQVTPFLQAGEQPVVATRAMVGKFSSSRLGTVVSQAVRLEGGGALVGAALASTRKQFVVLTNRRLIFLPQTFLGGPGKKVLGEVPREQVSLAEAKMGVVSLLRLAFGAAGDGVALTFPRVDKKNAESLAEALRHAPAA